MSKQQILAELDNIGIERNPLEEFLNIEKESAISLKGDEDGFINSVRDSKMGRPRTRENYKHCSLDLPMDIYEALRTMSFQRAIPMNSIVITAINKYLKSE